MVEPLGKSLPTAVDADPAHKAESAQGEDAQSTLTPDFRIALAVIFFSDHQIVAQLCEQERTPSLWLGWDFWGGFMGWISTGVTNALQEDRVAVRRIFLS